MIVSLALAQATPAVSGSAPGGAAAFMVQVLPLALIFLVFWFLIIRPQQQKLKAHRAMVDGVKKGDEVVTGGGLIGKVTRVDDQKIEIEVEIAPNVRVRIVRSMIADVRAKGEPVKEEG